MKKTLLACSLLFGAVSMHAYDVVTSVSIDEGSQWNFDVELADNEQEFIAFQMDVTLDGAASLLQNSLHEGPLCRNHRVAIGEPEGRLRILGYSMQSEPFAGSEGHLCSFSIAGEVSGVKIDKIIFVKADGTEVEAKAYSKPLNRADYEDGIQSVEANRPQKVVYDLSGKQVYHIDQRGIYIQNGQKVAR